MGSQGGRPLAVAVKSFATDYQWTPAGPRPHWHLPMTAPVQELAAVYTATLADWRRDWRTYLQPVRPTDLHVTLARIDVPAATVPPAVRQRLSTAVAERLSRIPPIDITIGPARIVTYGLELDIDPDADQPLETLSAAIRGAARDVLGPDAPILDPDPRWAYPHLAIARCTHDVDDTDLPGWLAHTRTSAGHRPHRTTMTATRVLDCDHDPFVPATTQATTRPTPLTLAGAQVVVRETIDALSDNDLVRDLAEGLSDARAGRVFSAEDIAADLHARRDTGE